MMNKALIVGGFAVLILFTSSLALDCSEVILKEQEGLLDWLGTVHFTVPFTVNGWVMTITFDFPYTGVGVWDVWTNQTSDRTSLFWNRTEKNNDQLMQNQPFDFRFRVNYGRDVPQPQVISLKFETNELCRL